MEGGHLLPDDGQIARRRREKGDGGQTRWENGN